MQELAERKKQECEDRTSVKALSTYIRLEIASVYLAAVQGAPRDRLGAGANAGDDLAIAALQMAFDECKPEEGVAHCSNKGSQEV